MYFLKMNNPVLYKRMMPFGGELHRQFHGLDAVYRLDWDFWIEPLALLLHRTDIKEKQKAEENNKSDILLRITTIGIHRWLKNILKKSPSAPRSPGALMDDLKNNIVAWDLVGFLYYRAGWYMQDRYATRVGDVEQLDQNWRYMGILAHSTGKTNYARHSLKMKRVLHDTDSTLRTIFSSKARFYYETYHPCTARGLDTACERVSHEHTRCKLVQAVHRHKDIATKPSNARYIAANGSMTALVENASQYEDYIFRDVQMLEEGHRYMPDVEEDLELIVQILDGRVGASYADLCVATEESKFAARPMPREKTGTD